ncbi:MAG: 16S rRNA (guanine(527)-N(7))-methyltransferase RsmG [Bacteroidales bacterium]
MELIQKYFPILTAEQTAKFTQLQSLYLEWNSQINVISRKDMEHFYEHHVLHSLGIACVQQFLPGSQVMDVGTGGGFPGIPLAIMFPETEFLLVDSIGKKIKVVNEVAKAAGITNVKAIQSRAEDVKQKFDFVVSRAVTTLPEFVKWIENNIKKDSRHSLKNGILYLKGGDLEAELAPFKKQVPCLQPERYFFGSFFETKKVVHLRL